MEIWFMFFYELSIILFEMINRMIYKQQPMNLIHTTKNGT